MKVNYAGNLTLFPMYSNNDIFTNPQKIFGNYKMASTPKLGSTVMCVAKGVCTDMDMGSVKLWKSIFYTQSTCTVIRTNVTTIYIVNRRVTMTYYWKYYNCKFLYPIRLCACELLLEHIQGVQEYFLHFNYKGL